MKTRARSSAVKMSMRHTVPAIPHSLLCFVLQKKTLIQYFKGQLKLPFYPFFPLKLHGSPHCVRKPQGGSYYRLNFTTEQNQNCDNKERLQYSPECSNTLTTTGSEQLQEPLGVFIRFNFFTSCFSNRGYSQERSPWYRCGINQDEEGGFLPTHNTPYVLSLTRVQSTNHSNKSLY